MNKDTTLTGPELQEALVLATRLVKTFASPTFRKSLKEFWKGAVQNDNIFAIQNKLCGDIGFRIAQAQRYGTIDSTFNYLRFMAEEKGCKVVNPRGARLITSLSMKDYNLLSLFVYEVSCKVDAFGRQVAVKANCHEILWSIGNYLVSRDSIENGVEHRGLQKMLDTLIKTKPVSFWRSGYLHDVLVHDRLLTATTPNLVYGIFTHKDYLSTTQILAREPIVPESAEFDVFLMKSAMSKAC